MRIETLHDRKDHGGSFQGSLWVSTRVLFGYAESSPGVPVYNQGGGGGGKTQGFDNEEPPSVGVLGYRPLMNLNMQPKQPTFVFRGASY